MDGSPLDIVARCIGPTVLGFDAEANHCISHISNTTCVRYARDIALG